MKGRATIWSAEERDWIKANSRRPRAKAFADFQARFGRADVRFGAFTALCKRMGWMTGRDGKFHSGQVSWNKGQSMPFHPASAATRFKPGERLGAARHNWVPVGTERISLDGYRERKTSDDAMPPRRRWQAVHRLNWEALNGPLPPGHALKCLDGDRANVDAANWVAVPRALLPHLVPGRFGSKLNYDAAPAEVKPSILALARLRHAVNAARRAHSPEAAE